MKDETNDPIEKPFCVKFFRNVVLFIKFCQLVGGGGGGGGGVFEGERAGGSKSFRRFHFVCRGVLAAMFVGAA